MGSYWTGTGRGSYWQEQWTVTRRAAILPGFLEFFYLKSTLSTQLSRNVLVRQLIDIPAVTSPPSFLKKDVEVSQSRFGVFVLQFNLY